jgi:hypothetical protein
VADFKQVLADEGFLPSIGALTEQIARGAGIPPEMIAGESYAPSRLPGAWNPWRLHIQVQEIIQRYREGKLEMTEQEWLTCDDPARMLRLYTSDEMPWPTGSPAPVVSERKLRLFAIACARAYPWPKHREVEHHFNFLIPLVESCLDDGAPMPEHPTSLKFPGLNTVHRGHARGAATYWSQVANRQEHISLPLSRRGDLLREIVGNPFRPHREMAIAVRHDPVPLYWLTLTVLTLAKTAYEERASITGHLDHVRLAVLADALEEAGCTDREPDTEVDEYETCGNCNGHGNDVGSARYPEDQLPCFSCGGTGGILRRRFRRGNFIPHPVTAHLRLPGPHVRGCWALDMILGKT